MRALCVCGVSKYGCLRIYDAKPPGDSVVHVATIVSNFEFAHTPCGVSRSAGGIHEAPRGSLVTCIRCLAVMLAKKDGWL